VTANGVPGGATLTATAPGRISPQWLPGGHLGRSTGRRDQRVVDDYDNDLGAAPPDHLVDRGVGATSHLDRRIGSALRPGQRAGCGGAGLSVTALGLPQLLGDAVEGSAQDRRSFIGEHPGQRRGSAKGLGHVEPPA